MFVKGQSGNPKGRPKGTGNRYSIESFKDAIGRVEKDKNINFYDEVVKFALRDKTVMSSVINKLLPSMVATDHTFPEDLVDQLIGVVPGNGKNVPEHFARFLN